MEYINIKLLPLLPFLENKYRLGKKFTKLLLLYSSD